MLHGEPEAERYTISLVSLGIVSKQAMGKVKVQVMVLLVVVVLVMAFASADGQDGPCPLYTDGGFQFICSRAKDDPAYVSSCCNAISSAGEACQCNYPQMARTCGYSVDHDFCQIPCQKAPCM